MAFLSGACGAQFLASPDQPAVSETTPAVQTADEETAHEKPGIAGLFSWAGDYRTVTAAP